MMRSGKSGRQSRRGARSGGATTAALSCVSATAGGRRPIGWNNLESTTGAEPPHLARKPNYDFEKRRKELDRKAKKDAKREERLQRTQENAANGVEGVDPDLEGIVLGPQPTADDGTPQPE